jgi:hypothetical protein
LAIDLRDHHELAWFTTSIDSGPKHADALQPSRACAPSMIAFVARFRPSRPIARDKAVAKPLGRSSDHGLDR